MYHNPPKKARGGVTKKSDTSPAEESSMRNSRRVATPGTRILDEMVTLGEKIREKADDSRIVLRNTLNEVGGAKEVMDPNTEHTD